MDALNWSKVTVKKNIHNITNAFLLQVFWTFYPKKYYVFHKNMKQHINNNNHVSWAANQHIRMISEGSCDTEGWSNDAENSALIKRINYILQYIQIENGYFKL